MADMHSIPTLLEDLRQQVSSLQRRQSEMGSRVARLDKVTNASKREFIIDTAEAVRGVTDAVADLTEQVGDLLYARQQSAQQSRVEISFLRHQQSAQTQEKAANLLVLAETRALSKCRQRTTPVCPCGQHQGIQFYNGHIIIENMCPQEWWIRQSRVAFEDGKLKQFINTTSCSVYLSAYSI
jgi:hypothetical protein